MDNFTETIVKVLQEEEPSISTTQARALAKEIMNKLHMVDQDLKTCAMPLIRYLNDFGHPHYKAIVTTTGVELLESQRTFIKVYDFVNYTPEVED